VFNLLVQLWRSNKLYKYLDISTFFLALEMEIKFYIFFTFWRIHKIEEFIFLIFF